MYLDKPITEAENDLLNRNDFAVKLAKSISSWRNKESWVIALTGDWGSGKTSIKNLMVKELKKAENPIHIIEFSPWEWADQELITQSFFNELSKDLAIESNDKKTKEVAEQFKKYAYYLGHIQSVSEPAIKVLPLIFGALMLINNFFSEELSNFVIAVIGIWLVVFQGLGKFFELKVNRLEYLSKENKKSLFEVKQDIQKSLDTFNSPILIILDDLDRLSSSQLLTITQLVKANSDFSNIIFLLLYSKSIVEEKLTDKNQNGTAYMEKIIQVDFAVPKVDTNLIINLLNKKLDEITTSLTIKNKSDVYDETYLSYVFNEGKLVNYFKDLRNLYRFLNSFEFNVNSFIKNDFLEVNFTDLFAIEVIRLFEPKLYEGIINNKNFLIKGYENPNTRITQNNNQDELLLKAKEFLAKFEGFGAEDCLKTIFPVFNGYFHNLNNYLDYGQNSIKELRICNEQNFNNYFMQGVPEHIVSQSELNDYFDSLSSLEVANSKILKIFNENKLTSFQEKVEFNLDLSIVPNQINFFMSLKHLAEFIRPVGFLDESFLFRTFTIRMLDKLDENRIFYIAKEISRLNDRKFKLLINFYYHFKERNNNYNLNNPDFLSFKDNLRNYIEDELLNNYAEFKDRDNKVLMLGTWLNLDEQSVKNFITNKFNNPNDFFETLELFLSSSIKQKYINKDTLYSCIDKTAFENLLIQNSQRQDLSEKELELLEIYNKPREW
jgi:predicted KAP-like P-loop ATPase